jgi:hypothetical protein
MKISLYELLSVYGNSIKRHDSENEKKTSGKNTQVLTHFNLCHTLARRRRKGFWADISNGKLVCYDDLHEKQTRSLQIKI